MLDLENLKSVLEHYSKLPDGQGELAEKFLGEWARDNSCFASLEANSSDDMKLNLVLPEDSRNIPESIMLLVAMFIRLKNDPEWISDLVRWFSNYHRSSEG